jgi:hypothetical protein
MSILNTYWEMGQLAQASYISKVPESNSFLKNMPALT